MPAIEINGLSKDYKVGFWRQQTRRALNRLSLNIEKGEVIGFLGPNGAGKTTTIKIPMGLIFPTEGTAHILGQPAGQPEAYRSVGFLPEQPYFYDYLTAAELLDYLGSFFPFTSSERRQRRDVALDQVGLSDARHMQLRKYSKGMLQRAGIAQAIFHDPELVILDEPMSGLDPIGRREIRDLMVALKSQGKTVFFSTHILSDAEALCDRVAILNRGDLVGIGPITDLLKPQKGYEATLFCSSADRVKELESLTGRAVVASGGQFRMEITDEKLQDFLTLCSRDGIRLLSLNPVRLRLEDVFEEILQLPQPGISKPQEGQN